MGWLPPVDDHSLGEVARLIEADRSLVAGTQERPRSRLPCPPFDAQAGVVAAQVAHGGGEDHAAPRRQVQLRRRQPAVEGRIRGRGVVQRENRVAGGAQAGGGQIGMGAAARPAGLLRLAHLDAQQRQLVGGLVDDRRALPVLLPLGQVEGRHEGRGAGGARHGELAPLAVGAWVAEVAEGEQPLALGRQLQFGLLAAHGVARFVAHGRHHHGGAHAQVAQPRRPDVGHVAQVGALTIRVGDGGGEGQFQLFVPGPRARSRPARWTVRAAPWCPA